jgi:hypothetical protein
VANIENCFIKSNARIATASGRLERLDDMMGIVGCGQAFAPHAQLLQDTAGGGITREMTGLHPIEHQHPKGKVDYS